MATKTVMGSILLAAVLITAGCGGSEASGSSDQLRAVHTDEPVVVDGKLDEKVWDSAGTLSSSLMDSWSPGRYLGDMTAYVVYFLYDSRNLYVGLKANDRQVEKGATAETSDGIYSLSFFDGQRAHHYRIWWSDFPPQPGGAMGEVSAWSYALEGTWNSAHDQDGGYSIEIAIPLARIEAGYGKTIPMNLILIDHDFNPGGAYDDDTLPDRTEFRKLWFGSADNDQVRAYMPLYLEPRRK